MDRKTSLVKIKLLQDKFGLKFDLKQKTSDATKNRNNKDVVLWFKNINFWWTNSCSFYKRNRWIFKNIGILKKMDSVQNKVEILSFNWLN